MEFVNCFTDTCLVKISDHDQLMTPKMDRGGGKPSLRRRRPETRTEQQTDETSFALSDTDLPKLLQCKECSVVLKRLNPNKCPKPDSQESGKEPDLEAICKPCVIQLTPVDVPNQPKTACSSDDSASVSSDDENDLVGPSPPTETSRIHARSFISRRSFETSKNVTSRQSSQNPANEQQPVRPNDGLSPIKGAPSQRLLLTQNDTYLGGVRFTNGGLGTVFEDESPRKQVWSLAHFYSDLAHH